MPCFRPNAKLRGVWHSAQWPRAVARYSPLFHSAGLAASATNRRSLKKAAFQNPTADQVNRTEAVLKKLGKTYEFHRYDGAGHAFFNYARAPAYRADQATEGWKKTYAFFKKHLG